METRAVTCLDCGTEAPPGHRFCANCGSPVRRECPACGNLADAQSTFCPDCGELLTPAPAESVPQQAEVVTERRLVTVLFADLVGFTSRSERQDPEEVASFLGDYFERSRDVITRFGGIVEKYIGDAVMAVWGATTANEDDAERAVRAGLELQEAIAKLAAESGDSDITVRIGILSGEAAVRADGDDATGMIVGDLVNSAARLQQVAEPGTVLVGESTYRAASNAISFEPAGTPALKGKQTPITTWRARRVVAERRGRGRVEGLDPPFVGRQDEMQLLKDLLAGVTRDGRARFVSIVGEVGIGKSRLIWELQKYADGLAGTLFWNQGRSPSYGAEGIAYRAVSEMLRRRIGVDDTDDTDVAATALDAALDEFIGDLPERSRVQTWLGALLCCGQSPDGDRSELDAAIRTFIGGMAAQGPVVLVFEDMQWADAGVLDFVEQLVDWMPDAPLLVLALTRPDLFEHHPGWTSGRRGVVTLRLGPLNDDGMGALLDGMITDLAPGLRASIIDKADGVPLFAVELARAFMGRNDAAPGRDRVEVAADIAIPASLRSLIDSRIDRLDPADRALLQDAAVLGHAFTIGGLAALTGQSDAALISRLPAFVARQLLQKVRDPGAGIPGAYEFVQDLVREVVYSRLSHEVRRARHVAAAEYVEALGGPDQAMIAADHYLSALAATPAGAGADDFGHRAAGVLARALERAADIYAHTEVLSLGTRITELDHFLPIADRAAIEILLAKAASALLRPIEAERHGMAAIDLYRDAGDVAGTRRAVAVAALVYIDNFRQEPAIELLEEHLDGIDDLAADPDLARLAGLLARALFLKPDHAAALEVADRALVAAEQLSLDEVVGDLLVTKATILGLTGRSLEARMLLESVIETATRSNFFALALRAYINLGEVVPHHELGSDPTLDAIELGRRIGNLNFTLLAMTNRAGELVGRCSWADADEVLSDPLWQAAVGTPAGSRLELMAVAAAARGKVAEAEARLAEAQAVPDENTEPGFLFGLAATTVLVRLMAGDTAPGLDWAGAVLSDPGFAFWFDPVAHVLLLAGEPGQITELADLIASGTQTIDHRLRAFLGAVAPVLSGDPDSVAAAEAVLDALDDDRMALDEVIWTIGLGRMLDEGSADRIRVMSAARDLVAGRGLAGLARFIDADSA